jgi:hypothetical protein
MCSEDGEKEVVRDWAALYKAEAITHTAHKGGLSHNKLRGLGQHKLKDHLLGRQPKLGSKHHDQNETKFG